MTRQMTVAACRMKSSLSVDEFMVVARHMTGRICGGITAIGLSAAVMFAAPVADAAGSSATELYGADISRLIVQKLAGQGLEGAPGIRPDRLFHLVTASPKSSRCSVAGPQWPFAV